MNETNHCDSHKEHMALHKQERQEEQEFKRMIISKIDKILENQAAQELKAEKLKLQQFRFCTDQQQNLLDNVEDYVDECVDTCKKNIIGKSESTIEDVEKSATDNKSALSVLKKSFDTLSGKITRFEMYILAVISIIGFFKLYK